MREALSLLRASWLTASSYRFNMALSFVSLLATVVPLYFVSRALQPLMADSIRTEAGEYFGFLLVGLVALSLITQAVSELPRALGAGIATGTLESLLTTPVSLPTILAGLVSYGFVWNGVRAAVFLVAGWVLGARIAWEHSLVALVILSLIILAHLPIGLLAASLVLVFRTPGPLPHAVIVISGLLGGVYYPTHVIPSWLQDISGVLPLTYGLRALRRVILDGASVGGVAADLGVLSGFAVVSFGIGSLAFVWASQHARRAGTLSQY